MRFLYSVSPLLAVVLMPLRALAQQDKHPDPVYPKKVFVYPFQAQSMAQGPTLIEEDKPR